MRVPCLLLASSVMLIAGCSIAPIASKSASPTPTPTPTPGNVTPVKGTVHGGQQGLIGASVYMYAVSMTGYGSSSNSRLTGTGFQDANGLSYVTTGANGQFSIAADEITCGASGTTEQVYLFSLGGTPGSTASPNTAAGLMAVLGSCTNGSFSNLPGTVQMNEVTTVAAAYALAGFALDATDIAAGPTTPPIFVANAAQSATNLASLATGQALQTTPNGNGAVPQLEINTLADILASCVNSTAPNYDPNEPMDACGTLFANATDDGSPAKVPSETATAAINIAHHPGSNIAELMMLATPTAPFLPNFITAGNYVPNDWTMAITYTGGGINEPGFLAIDASGNIWTSNTGNNSISEFSPTGAPFVNSPFSGGGLSEPQGIAIDTAGNVWVANFNGGEGTGSVTEYSSGTWTPYTDPGLSGPTFLSIDSNNNAWVSNSTNNTISAFNTSSTTSAVYKSTPTDTITNGLNTPEGIAVDPSGDVWVANNGAASVSVFTVPEGVLTPGTPSTDGSMNGPQGLAVDGSGDVWVANNVGTSVTKLVVSSGSVTSGTAYGDVGGLNAPLGIVIDGLGNVWATDDPLSGAVGISELNSSGTALSPNAGYVGVPVAPATSVLTNPTDIAIDGSGNVWVVDVQFSIMDPPASGPDNVVEFVGAAAPVVTPLAVGVKNGTLGTRP